MRLMREIPELRETDGESEIRFFVVSKQTAEWLIEHGSGIALPMTPDESPVSGRFTISIAAFVEDGQWNGWNWLHDELVGSGLNPREFGF